MWLFCPKATFTTFRGSLRSLRRVAARALERIAFCATTLRFTSFIFGACVRRAPSEPASVASVVIKLFFFHHGKHRNALGLLRLSLRESSSLRSSVNLTPSAQANSRDTEEVNEISLRITRPQFVRNLFRFLSLGLHPRPYGEAAYKTIP